MNTPRIVITHPVPMEVIELLSGICHVTLDRSGGPSWPDEMLQQLVAARAIMMCRKDLAINEALLSCCPHLQVIAATFEDPGNIDIEACTRKGVWVTTVPEETYALPFGRNHALQAAMEATANIIEALSGALPKGAINRPVRARGRRAADVSQRH
jgi:phosphoglycerate dehydrogenase-like enzyme